MSIGCYVNAYKCETRAHTALLSQQIAYHAMLMFTTAVTNDVAPHTGNKSRTNFCKIRMFVLYLNATTSRVFG